MKVRVNWRLIIGLVIALAPTIVIVGLLLWRCS